MKIYTKTGDRGTTSLFNGQRVLKNNLRVCPYGEVDELNSILGVVCAYLENEKNTTLYQEIQSIQSDLLTIGSQLANPDNVQDTAFDTYLKKRITALEKSIDVMTNTLPLLQNFILPGGGIVGSFLHVARTVSRRAEREIVSLAQKEEVSKHILIYINRLSDVFFTMSRYINNRQDKQELIWSKNIK